QSDISPAVERQSEIRQLLSAAGLEQPGVVIDAVDAGGLRRQVKSTQSQRQEERSQATPEGALQQPENRRRVIRPLRYDARKKRNRANCLDGSDILQHAYLQFR